MSEYTKCVKRDREESPRSKTPSKFVDVVDNGEGSIILRPSLEECLEGTFFKKGK